MRRWIASLAAVAALGARAAGGGAAQTPAPAAGDAAAARPSFAEFLEGVREEALARGIRADVVEAALAQVPEPLPIVIERDRTQAETILPLERYLARRLDPATIKAGRTAAVRERALLNQVSRQYGVPPPILVAVWGMESNFGRFSGVRPTIAALATLAWDTRRPAMFRSELFAALEILQDGDVELSRMRGSWAGAMGQVQFMPSSYLKFAEDFDGDGRRDIWSSLSDVFASIANYLRSKGWAAGEGWGREVHIADPAAARIQATVARRAGGCQATRDMTVPLPAVEWRRLGVELPDGRPLPAGTPDAALVSGASRHFLVYRNYDALLEYNCAHSYAIAVGLLADRIGGGGAFPRARVKRAVPRARRSRRR